jgi:hypothetical protein
MTIYPGTFEDTNMTNEQLATWLRIGRENYWIGLAYDPPFTERSFYACATLRELKENLAGHAWSVGTAFVYQNICFINQIDGGNEFLVIRDDLPFESFSTELMVMHDFEPVNGFDRWSEEQYKMAADNKGYFDDVIARVLRATPAQLRGLKY